MQYILTEEEYKNLVKVQEYWGALEMIEKLNEEVLKLKGFSCVMNEGRGGYCDNCPIGGFGLKTCTKTKRYSK